MSVGASTLSSARLRRCHDVILLQALPRVLGCGFTTLLNHGYGPTVIPSRIWTSCTTFSYLAVHSGSRWFQILGAGVLANDLA